MMHYSLHQLPALGLRLSQPGLQFIAEGQKLVDFGEDRAVVLFGNATESFEALKISHTPIPSLS